jgi:hypothetical protein
VAVLADAGKLILINPSVCPYFYGMKNVEKKYFLTIVKFILLSLSLVSLEITY